MERVIKPDIFSDVRKIGDKNLWITYDGVIKDLLTGKFYYTHKKYIDLMYKEIGVGGYSFMKSLDTIDTTSHNDLLVKKWNNYDKDRLAIYLNNGRYYPFNPRIVELLYFIYNYCEDDLHLKLTNDTSDDFFLNHKTEYSDDNNSGIYLSYAPSRGSLSIYGYLKNNGIRSYNLVGSIDLEVQDKSSVSSLLEVAIYTTSNADEFPAVKLSWCDTLKYAKLWGNKIRINDNTFLTEEDLLEVSDLTDREKELSTSPYTIREVLTMCSQYINTKEYDTRTYIRMYDELVHKYL